MRPANPSSRQRYRRYTQEFKERRAAAGGGGSALPGWHPGTTSAPGISGYKRQRTFWVLFKEFMELWGSYHWLLVPMLGCLTVSTVLALVPLYNPKLVFDNILGGMPLSPKIPAWIRNHFPANPHHALALLALETITVSIFAITVGMWSRYQATRLTKLVQVSVRRRVFEHAVRLPLHRVYDLKSGGAASLLRDDAGGVGDLIFAMIYNPCRAIIQLAGSLIILTLTDFRLLLGSLLLIPAVYLTHKTWIARIRPLFADIRATRTYTDSHATETFGGMRVVRSFARQRSESGQFTRNNDLMARQEVLSWWWSRAIDIAWGLLVPTATAILFWYGGSRILDDRARVAAGTLASTRALTVGDLVMFVTYVGWLLGPLETLATSATQLQNSLSGLDRVLSVLGEPTEMPSLPGSIHVSRDTPAASIVLRGVSFTYPRLDKPVLEDINLQAEPGQLIALVGHSSAGKTTLCNLIARFYDPTAGSITFGGVDLRDIDVDSYRSLLGIVEQDTFLFDGTIGDNIRYGKRHATMEEIAEAARLANADEFISKLPKGYHSTIGERGVKLSGGQRQRLTIARAILADPRILILDEATSNLDTESERLIQGSLQNLMAGRTSFVIAHRLSTIMHADRILVLEHGRIVEEGRHAELLERSGRYRQMVDIQTQPPVAPKTAALRA